MRYCNAPELLNLFSLNCFKMFQLHTHINSMKYHSQLAVSSCMLCMKMLLLCIALINLFIILYYSSIRTKVVLSSSSSIFPFYMGWWNCFYEVRKCVCILRSVE
jgi:hypothetical protein